MTGVCMKCLKEGRIKKINIPELEYGGGFDGFSTVIQLCEDCYEKTNPVWWELEVVSDIINGDWMGETYRYEDEIFNFVESCPIEGQELFFNRFASGSFTINPMESQDWIDYELGILSHEKCKQYGRYSPQEIQAYNFNFPTCDCVHIDKYEDGSIGSSCDFGARGNENGNVCSLGNIWNACYTCTHYRKRRGSIKAVEVKDDEFKIEDSAKFQEMLECVQSQLWNE